MLNKKYCLFKPKYECYKNTQIKKLVLNPNKARKELSKCGAYEESSPRHQVQSITNGVQQTN
jgi:hypothetical protein